MPKIIIAVDGYSSCGKSTTAKGVAAYLGYAYIDTGAMYRAVTLYFMTQHVSLTNPKEVAKALENIKIDFRRNPETGRNETYLNGLNVEDEIRKLYIANWVSEVSAVSEVRRAMVAQQQRMGKAEVLELAEAIVKPHSDSGRAILREALKRLKKNYPTKMHQLNAFYREKVQSRDDYGYTRLMEGMVDIQDWGIDSDPERMRIRVNEYRKSNNLAKQTLGQRAWYLMFDKDNPLYDILAQDPVRIHTHNERTTTKVPGYKWTRNSRSYWLGEMLKSPDASVRLVDLTSYDGEQVYHLKFKYPSYRGDIYINSEDYGIHHIDYYLGSSFSESLAYLKLDTNNLSEKKKIMVKDMKTSTENMQHEGKYIGKLKVDYQKTGEKYYLSYIEWMTMGDFRKSKIHEGKTTGSYNFCSLMVNEVQTDKKEMAKVKPRQALNRKEDTDDVRKQYNERFWRNYNVLLATPLENKVIRDLTFEESLEQQFKKNQ